MVLTLVTLAYASVTQPGFTHWWWSNRTYSLNSFSQELWYELESYIKCHPYHLLRRNFFLKVYLWTSHCMESMLKTKFIRSLVGPCSWFSINNLSKTSQCGLASNGLGVDQTPVKMEVYLLHVYFRNVELHVFISPGPGISLMLPCLPQKFSIPVLKTLINRTFLFFLIQHKRLRSWRLMSSVLCVEEVKQVLELCLRNVCRVKIFRL